MLILGEKKANGGGSERKGRGSNCGWDLLKVLNVPPSSTFLLFISVQLLKYLSVIGIVLFLSSCLNLAHIYTGLQPQ